MAVGSWPTLVNRRDPGDAVCERELTLIERLDSEEGQLRSRLEDITRLRDLLAQNPDVHEILKLMGRRY